MIVDVSLSRFKIHEYSKYRTMPGINAIIGPGGCGKTSIMEAIGWAVFGTLTGKKSNFMSLDGGLVAHESFVELAMIVDDSLTEIHKSIGGFSSLYIQYRMVAEGEMAVREAVADLVGYKRLDVLFSGLIGITQGSLDAIFARSTSERVKVFSRILGIDKYRDFSDWLLKSSQELDIKAAAVKGSLSGLEVGKVEQDAMALVQDEVQLEFDSFSRSVEDETILNSSLNKTSRILAGLRLGIKEAEDEIKHIPDAEVEMGPIEVELSSISALMCPTCGGPIDAVESEILYHIYNKKREKYHDGREEILRLSGEILSDKKIVGHLESLNIEARVLKSNATLAALRDKLAALRGKLEVLAASSDIKSRIENERTKLADMESSLAKISAIRSVARKLPALIAVDTTATVSELATEFVRMIYQNWTVTWNEDFSIDVRIGEMELSFTQLSKSQKGIASLSVILALAKLISPMDFILLDEPFANMDAEQVAAVAGAIRNTGWFKQVILTTHRGAEVEHIFDNVIEVET